MPQLDQRPLAPMAAGHTASGAMDSGVLDRRALKAAVACGHVVE